MIQSPTHSLGFDDRWFRIVGIPILGLIIPAIFFGKSFGFSEDYIRSAAIAILYTLAYWHICRAIFIWGNRKYPEVSQYLARLGRIVGLCFVTMLVFCNIMHLCIEKYIFGPQFQPPTNFQINAASFFCLLMIAAIYESKRYVMLWKKTSIEYEKLQRENIQSQLDGLKNQVNPHFLFNSLNTLIHIIPENPETAVRFVQQLSKVYRYILEIKDNPTTPLSHELEFLKAYVFLLKERFGDNLNIKLVNTEGYAESHMIPLALQIVLENAIKHNIISTEKPLLIEVGVENGNKLVVKNNLQRKNQVQIGTGTGLQNIKNRYQLVSQKQLDVIVTPQHFTVILPLL